MTDKRFAPWMCCALLTVALSLVPGVTQAGAEDNIEERMIDANAAPIKARLKGSWVFVPIPVSNPTVGSGLEVAVLYLHPPKPGQQTARGTTSGFGAMATDSGSKLAGVFHDASLANDRYRLSAFAGLGKFNLQYYGVGAGTAPGGQSIPYEFSGGAARLRGEARLPGSEHWFAGLTYLYLQTTVTFKTYAVVPGLPNPGREVRTAGLGPQISFDSRDSNYFPLQGTYFSARWADYAPRWGGDLSYDKADIFYNHYQPLAAQTVLALRARLQTASEGTPFYDLPTLDMRGFSRDRYRDKRSLSLIAELRHKFRPRWGAAAFVEAGRVAASLSAMADARTITTYGGGVRWQVTTDRPLHLGLDAAVSSDDSAVFIQVGERF